MTPLINHQSIFEQDFKMAQKPLGISEIMGLQVLYRQAQQQYAFQAYYQMMVQMQGLVQKQFLLNQIQSHQQANSNTIQTVDPSYNQMSQTQILQPFNELKGHFPAHQQESTSEKATYPTTNCVLKVSSSNNDAKVESEADDSSYLAQGQKNQIQSVAKEVPKQQKRISKNIPKNVFKGIVRYILEDRDTIRKYFTDCPDKIPGFIHFVKRHKNSVLSMQQMKKFLESKKNQQYSRLMRIFCRQFLKNHYVAYVYNSKIKCREEHMENRIKFIEMLRPVQDL